MRLLGFQSESEFEDDSGEESENSEEDVIDTISFDQWTESSANKDRERWRLKNGERVRDVLDLMTSKTVERAKELQLKGKKLDASILSTIWYIISFSCIYYFDAQC